MKLIIAGSRNLYMSIKNITACLDLHEIGSVQEVICGGASGPDRAGKAWALVYDVTVNEFPAEWDTHGKAAGPIRNRQMAEYGEALLLIWDGESRGSANMKKEMLKLNKPVYEVILKQPL